MYLEHKHHTTTYAAAFSNALNEKTFDRKVRDMNSRTIKFNG